MKKPVNFAVMALTGFVAAAQADVHFSERHALKQSLKAAGQHRSGGSGEATGSVALTDASGFQYFLNTDITFTTSSSASGAASEASYTAAVSADTSGGGTTASTLNDAFDGYGAICISTDGATGPCGNAPDLGSSTTMYNLNGPATTDCGGRQVVYPVQSIGSLAVSRKVYVPDADTFVRWANIVSNTGGAPVNVSLITSNNLGSDANTTISTTSDGDAVAEASDAWIASFQAFSGSTSSDPRLGHVVQNSGGTIPVASMSFIDGNDHGFWNYAFTLNPGETRLILTYATGQPTRAAAAAKAAAIAAAPDYSCLSSTEIGQIGNFGAGGPTPSIVEVPALSAVGLAALAALLCGAAFLVLRKQ